MMHFPAARPPLIPPIIPTTVMFSVWRIFAYGAPMWADQSLFSSLPWYGSDLCAHQLRQRQHKNYGNSPVTCCSDELVKRLIANCAIISTPVSPLWSVKSAHPSEYRSSFYEIFPIAKNKKSSTLLEASSRNVLSYWQIPPRSQDGFGKLDYCQEMASAEW